MTGDFTALKNGGHGNTLPTTTEAEPAQGAAKTKQQDNNMNKIIFLNGAPGSGKDEMAEAICFILKQEKLKVEHFKFAEPIRQMVQALGFNNVEHFKKINFKGGSGRDLMIHFSEGVVKPFIQKDHFGVVAGIKARESLLGSSHKTVVISDAGFDYEVAACLNHLDHQRTSALIINLQRDGHTYENDSRSDIDIKKVRELCPRWCDLHLVHSPGRFQDIGAVCSTTVYNNGEKIELLQKAKAIFDREYQTDH